MLFTQLSVNGHMGSFHLLAIVNNNVMNIDIQILVPVPAFNSFGYILRAIFLTDVNFCVKDWREKLPFYFLPLLAIEMTNCDQWKSICWIQSQERYQNKNIVNIEDISKIIILFSVLLVPPSKNDFNKTWTFTFLGQRLNLYMFV